MSDELRIQQLLHELLSSDATPEQVCVSCVELLPVVRERWLQVIHTRAELDAIFPPEADSTSDHPAHHVDDDTPFPEIPGYKVEAILGAGGMGVVFKARHQRLNRVVALKMALAGAYAGARERERFQREAESIAALRHPNVVQIHDVGDSDGKPFFTMEYVEGGTLAEKLNGTPLPVQEAATLMVTLATAVHAAHSGGIVHRDLKPGNVLLTADGTPKIGDFGLARRLNSEAALTRTGTAVGTASYMAPEQARGSAGAVGPTSDVYALGAILYETLTGRPPFRAESGSETVHQLLTQEPVPPSRLNAKVPRDLETICLKCLSKDPKGRYATAETLRDDLNRFLRGDSISARREGFLYRAMRFVRQRPTLAVSVGAGALIVALIIAGGLWIFLDRAVTHNAVTDDLREVDSSLEKSLIPEAQAALGRAEARMSRHTALSLRELIQSRQRDCDFAKLLERIDLDSATVIDSLDGFEQADKKYEDAFSKFGIGRHGDDIETVAAKIRDSRIHTILLAALDRWSDKARGTARAEWVLNVANAAEPERTPWRTDARNPVLRENRVALVALIDHAEVRQESVALLLSVSAALKSKNKLQPGNAGVQEFNRVRLEDSQHQIPFLSKVQQGHPSDLWANIYLGYALILGNQPDEAIRYFQTVIALRPDLPIGYHSLGIALNYHVSTRGPERYEEAIVQFRKGLAIDPLSARMNHSLATALSSAGKHDEAIKQAELSLVYNYNVVGLRSILGAGLKAKGRLGESIIQYRLALELEPDNPFILDNFRGVLLQARQWDELRTVWGSLLKENPPNHSVWYGYAELCLYLGQDAEYYRAREALLNRFGTNTAPRTAERTARACLLRPMSDGEIRKVATLAELAARVDRKQAGVLYPYLQFPKALADYRRGDFNSAIALMRGDASKMSGPLSQLVLAMALHQTDKKAEARRTFAEAMLNHDWREGNGDMPDGWIRHVLRREAERLIFPQLQATLDRKQPPEDNEERLALIGVCRFENRLAALTRIYTEAFAANPELAKAHRVTAARVATLAGCGHGTDAAGFSGDDRGNWRIQARRWLREELTARKRALDQDFEKSHDGVRQALTAWLTDPELSGIRDAVELVRLSSAEKVDCQRFWDEVQVILVLASKPH